MFKKIAKNVTNFREKLDQRVEKGDKNYRANNLRRLYTGYDHIYTDDKYNGI